MTEGFEGDAARGDVLAVAEGLYRDAALDLYRTIAAVRAGDFSEIKAAQSAIRDLRATALHVMRVTRAGRLLNLRR